jgi:hypothetical protein
MLAEHPTASAVRRPPAVRRGGRAALLSVAGHGLLVTLLASITLPEHWGSRESPLIIAELVTARVPDPPGTADEPAAEPQPAPAEVVDVEPVEPVEPPPASPAEPVAPAPAPQAAEPAPALEPPSERPEESPPEPLPTERFAEVPEPPTDVPTADDVAPAGAAPDVAPLPAPRRALASHEETAVRRQLASWTGQLSPEEGNATVVWRDAGQEYTAVLKRMHAADAMGMEQLLVELTTERGGEKLTAELRMNRVAFSNFAQFIDRWDPEVQIHDDLIDGRFHSNSEIRVSRDRGIKPVFTGKVTLAAGDVRTDGVGFLNRRTMFPAGLETRVRRIVLPPRAQTFQQGAVPDERTHRVTRDSLLTFHADGTFDARALDGDADATRGSLGDEPFYLIAAEDVSLHVRGTVNGKVLVYSPQHIVVVDDLRYAGDPRAPGADDYLGLVAERTVEIGEPELTGPGDLELHASVYARNRFTVREFRSRRSGTLIIYGSVAAGSVSATEPRYATRIEFDDRLTTMRAPGFPLSDRYELDSLSGEWRVLSASQ